MVAFLSVAGIGNPFSGLQVSDDGEIPTVSSGMPGQENPLTTTNIMKIIHVEAYRQPGIFHSALRPVEENLRPNRPELRKEREEVRE
jgi:hypothetical protein